ncbi:MAG: NAD(P)-binding domain-containing protein [Bacteroidales bacterium]|nr:NAD(P)-binding domain-containing protein [Bacteroidales bacterium]
MDHKKQKYRIAFIGAGAIGTALGNILAETEQEKILLHSIDPQIVDDITFTKINSKYFPALRLHQGLDATLDHHLLETCEVIFLAIPSVVMVGYLKEIRQHIPETALLVNLAKGFGTPHKTIVESLVEEFPNPVCTLKGPSFAREIINRMPTGFTLGYQEQTDKKAHIKSGTAPVGLLDSLFKGTNIHLDFSDDMRGVEILSILKNIYAVVLGIVDAHFNSPNLRFMILTKAFREMRKVLLWNGGKEETLFNYCGFGDFTLTALNDLSRNRTLGLLIGKGFFTEHVSHELVLEGKTAVNIFYSTISEKVRVEEQFPLMAELHKIFNTRYDVSHFVDTILQLP